MHATTPDDEKVTPESEVLNTDHVVGTDGAEFCQMYFKPWGGLDNWRCERCGGFSTLDKDVADNQRAACGLKPKTD